MARNNPCSNVQSEFGEGCYRSGDVFFIYCTPYSNQLLSERCNGVVSPGGGSNGRCNGNVSPGGGGCRRCCCRRNCCGNNSAFVGGDFGNCFY